MPSRQLLNLFLAILLAGLIALLIFEPGGTPPLTNVTLSRLNPEAVQKITLNKPGHDTISLLKINQQWRLSRPFSAPAKTARIEKLLAIVNAHSLAQYAANKIDRQQSGLDKPQFQLTLDDLNFSFGTTESISQNRYVQVDDSVHLIMDRYSYLLHGPATDFVDTRLLPEGAKIIALKLPTLELTLEGIHWRSPNNKAQFFTDSRQKLLDNWRFARALNVSRIKDNLADTKILIQLAGEAQAREYFMLQTSDEIIFQHPASGLQYHFTLASAQAMLNLVGAGSSTNLSEKP